jgi:hypothetical protein
MGIVTSVTSTCAGCLAGVITDEDNEATIERQDELKKGYKFMRSTMLGLSSQTIYVELSENLSLLKWKTINTGILSKQEHGEIDLTNDVKGVKMLGKNCLYFYLFFNYLYNFCSFYFYIRFNGFKYNRKRKR